MALEIASLGRALRRTGAFVAEKRPSLAILQDIPLTGLNAHVLGSGVRAINGVRPREKFLVYAKSMLTWAYSNSHESGFVVPAPWWPQIEPPHPSAEEIEKMRADAEKLRSRKTGFRIQHVGDLLARHEDFCAGKVAEDKISPGIRWGIWWIALTANRRGSTTVLERTNRGHAVLLIRTARNVFAGSGNTRAGSLLHLYNGLPHTGD